MSILDAILLVSSMLISISGISLLTPQKGATHSLKSRKDMGSKS